MKKLTLCVCLLLGMTYLALSSALGGPLYDAAKEGDIDEVKRLIAKGANVNAKDKRGFTALFPATLRGHKTVVQLLIANGTNVNATSWSPAPEEHRKDSRRRWTPKRHGDRRHRH